MFISCSTSRFSLSVPSSDRHKYSAHYAPSSTPGTTNEADSTSQTQAWILHDPWRGLEMGSQPDGLRDFSAISHSMIRPATINPRGQLDKKDSRGTHKRRV
jgi:hypothetical protein